MFIPNLSAVPLSKETSNHNSSPAVSQQKFGFTSFVERALKYFGAGAAINVISSKIIIPFMNSGMDWCPTFPKPLYTYVINLCLIREYLPGLTGVYDTVAFKAPIIEELIFRVGLQDLILTRVPKAILNRFAPSYSGVVDSKIAKIAKIVLTAVAFSLAHAMPPEMEWPNCSSAKLVNTFVMGLILGGVQEVTKSPLMAMLVHSGANIQAAFMLELIGGEYGCPPAE